MDSLFDTITGLPVHPLVVHFAVVLLPLATIGVLVTVFRPALKVNYLGLSTAGVIIGTVATFIAKESGEALAERVGLPQRHSDLGTYLFIAALIFTGLTLLIYRQTRRNSLSDKEGFGILGLLATFIGLIVIGLSILTGHTGAEAVWKSRIAGGQEVSAGTSAGTITIDEVATHNSPSDCWSVVDGKVYNLTDWIDKHPGGAVIIESLCGKDGTAGFTAEHGGKEKPERELSNYLIGTLKSP